MNYLIYFLYLIKHKWFVFIECWKLGIPWLGVVHDWSKFRPSEMIPHVRWYLAGQNGYESFIIAQIIHSNRNKHHPTYWTMGHIVAEMPIKYRKEMLADWIGAARAKDNNLSEWWKQSQGKITLGTETRKWMEDKIGHFHKG